MTRNLTRTLLLSISAGLCCLALAQQAAGPQVATPTIRVTTHLVLVNVIATDKAGKPVTDLKAEDFTVEDNGKKQKLSVFSLQQPVAQAAQSELPPNIYSNKPEYHMPAGPLTVLLVDGLNTPFINQSQARLALIRYAATQVKAGQEVAIYALGTHLYRLQDFTNDPAVLRAAIESYAPLSLPEHGSTLTASRITSTAGVTESGARGGAAASAAMATAIQNIQQFQAEQAGPALQLRIETTLAAMRALSRDLAGHPGRKNLVWVTAGFPVSLIPQSNEIASVSTRSAVDPTAPIPLPSEQTYGAFNRGVLQESAEDVRRTSAFLSQAQIAIYPVDARGLMGASNADASSSGLSSVGTLVMGNDFGQTVSNSSALREASQASMQDLAQQTGGRVFKNRNDIDNCVGAASSEGGTYYALGYYPDKKKFDNAFHKLKVAVNRPGAQLRYRAGYFAVDPSKENRKERDAELAAALHDDAVQSTMVLFDARVVSPPPAEKATVPVQFLVQPDTFSMEEAKNGRRSINLDFYAAAFTPDGKVAANTGKTVSATITADQYAQVQQKGLLLPLEVKLSPGTYNLRLAVRDNRTGYLGTLGVPLTLAAPGK
jgi:VWFA-related protein